jgi:hypothetical protein
MPTNDQPTGLERELTWALDDLHAALQRATEATAAIKGLVPRLAATGSLFDEIEALVRTGRQHIGAGEAMPGTGITRPTLVVPPPSAPRPAPVLQPSASFTAPAGGSDGWAPVLDTPPAPASAETVVPIEQPEVEAPQAPPDLHCFRLEFESQPGPLDLRTVDDAVSEHPAVRDVALLDYDGHRATLKVWITPDASPSDVQDALKERASNLFASDQDVTIVALEDAA